MKIEILRYPTGDDWRLAKRATLETVGLRPKTDPSFEWKVSLLMARHSPIRLLPFVFELVDVPYWVSVHLCRHVHAVPFVKTQRNDRQSGYDRALARQDTPVNMMWSMNAEELCVIANKRLCNMASPETRMAVWNMCQLVKDKCPEFESVLVPACEYNHVCHEMNGGCGRFKCTKN